MKSSQCFNMKTHPDRRGKQSNRWLDRQVIQTIANKFNNITSQYLQGAAKEHGQTKPITNEAGSSESKIEGRGIGAGIH